MKNYQQALSLETRLFTETPDDRKLKRGTALYHMKVANLSSATPAHAVSEMKQAITVLEELAASDPQNTRARREVGFVHYAAGRLFSQLGDLRAALSSRRKALEMRTDR